MTIKKQFIFLSAIIIFIPIICAVIVYFNQYLRDSKRFLLEGSNIVNQLDTSGLEKKETQALIRTFKHLPPDVQVLLLGDNGRVLYTSMPELLKTQSITKEETYNFISKESDRFFIQFTSPVKDKDFLLITRIPRQKHRPDRRRNVVSNILIFLVLTVSLCVLLIIFISTSIFKAIMKIKSKTQQMADGNLSEKITDGEINPDSNEITSILNSLETMRLAILEMQNKKNQFIMGISHDLRTPVAIIKGYSEAITDGVITEHKEIINSVELIEAKTTQLENMINTLLNIMKLNNFEIRENLTLQSITQLIKDFANEAVQTGNIFKRKIITNIQLEKDIKIKINEMLVQRSLENLFTNAIRYTNEGDTIQIDSFVQGNKIILKLSDTGIGIAQKDLPHIFDVFYRGTNSRREEGIGIGLSLVKNVVDTLGWKISVDSKAGEGTCFTLSIPFH